MAMQAVKRARGASSDELAVIAQRAQAFTNASGTAIALSDGGTEEIICRARAGSSAPEVGTALQVEGTFTGLCIQSGRELCCNDTETDGRVDKTAIRDLGIRSMVAVPIKEQGRVVGVLAVFAATANAFTITHVAVLKTLAGQVAGYLERKHGDEASSRVPFPGSPPKALAAAAAPASADMTQPSVKLPTPRRIPAVPKPATGRVGTLGEEIDPASFNKAESTNSHGRQKSSKAGFWPALGAMDAAEGSGKRLGAKALIFGAAAVVLIAVAVGLAYKLRKPDAPPQPAVETLSSPVKPSALTPASDDVQPRAKNPLPSPAEREEVQAKHTATIVLSVRPSRISLPAGARDNSAPSETPAISLGSMPVSGSLSSLASPASASTPSILRTQSALEPIEVIKKVQPVYPTVAKARRLSGSVVLLGTVGKNGRISDLQLISGPPVFRAAAFDAVRQWVFKPARLNGQAIDQSTKIRLDFAPE